MQPDLYRNMMRHHAGAPVVVATGKPGARTGLTATAFCSLSDSPPTVLICVNRNASAHPIIRQTGTFSVNILNDEQADVAACFSGQTGLKGEERFACHGNWVTCVTGAPVMTDALASLDCEVLNEYEHGTHSVFVGLVKAARIQEDSDPLIYFRGSFCGLAQTTV
jgi:flavin reductase (DIM6/NTAB) family NADH-FMN oxidoreductase RutF